MYNAIILDEPFHDRNQIVINVLIELEFLYVFETLYISYHILIFVSVRTYISLEKMIVRGGYFRKEEGEKDI